MATHMNRQRILKVAHPCRDGRHAECAAFADMFREHGFEAPVCHCLCHPQCIQQGCSTAKLPPDAPVVNPYLVGQLHR